MSANELAITDRTGESTPEATLLRFPSRDHNVSISTGGLQPFMQTAQLIRQTDPTAQGPRNIFAGQEGETPLTYALRRPGA